MLTACACATEFKELHKGYEKAMEEIKNGNERLAVAEQRERSLRDLIQKLYDELQLNEERSKTEKIEQDRIIEEQNSKCQERLLATEFENKHLNLRTAELAQVSFAHKILRLHECETAEFSQSIHQSHPFTVHTQLE